MPKLDQNSKIEELVERAVKLKPDDKAGLLKLYMEAFSDAAKRGLEEPSSLAKYFNAQT